MQRPSLDHYFLAMLNAVSSRSTCKRRHVAAIIINEKGHILATGYNGVPSGLAHCIDIPCPGADDPSGDSSRCEALHAEASALLQCFDLSKARTMYCSCTPCFNCAKMICNTPIKRIVAQVPYPDQPGIELLKRKGVAIEVAGEKWT